MTCTWVHIVGARPNFPKFAPVFSSLRSKGVRQRILHTGQHYDTIMSESFFQDLDLPTADHDLGVGSESHARQTAAMMIGIEDFLTEQSSARVIVYGDTNSTLAGALVASKLRIPLVHIEAGLRSFDNDMPEEINRRIVDAVSDLLFTTSPEASDNLLREGVALNRTRFVGNSMIDSLRVQEKHLSRDSLKHLSLPTNYGVVTLHRPSNVDNDQRLTEIAQELLECSAVLPLVFPVHPRTAGKLRDSGLGTKGRVQLLEPLGYKDFLALTKFADAVITDSGGVQEETTAFGVPCLTLRDNTERPVTISHGTNQLVSLGDLTPSLVRKLDMPEHNTMPPLWDGRAGQRVAEALMDWDPSI